MANGLQTRLTSHEGPVKSMKEYLVKSCLYQINEHTSCHQECENQYDLG